MKPSAGRPFSSSVRIRSFTLWDTFLMSAENRAFSSPFQSPENFSKNSSAVRLVFSPVWHTTEIPVRSGRASRDTWSAPRQTASSSSALAWSVICSTVTVKSAFFGSAAVSSGFRPNFSMSFVNSSRKNRGYAAGSGSFTRLSSGLKSRGASVTIVANQ